MPLSLISAVSVSTVTPILRRLRGWGMPVILAVAPIAVAVAEEPARPNVIFILCDDLGYGDTGPFFQNARAARGERAEPWQLTPNLDRLAADGLRLTHHYAPAPVCAPSRASLLSGVHQGQAEVRDNQFDKALEHNHTLATVLKRAGYATAAIGKWGLQGGLKGRPEPAWEAYPLERGFDFFFGYVRHADGHEHYPKEGKYRGAKQVWENRREISAELDKCYTADLFTARAKRWIAEQRGAHPAQPFFLYLAYDTPHAVTEVPTMAYPPGGGLSGGLQWTGRAGEMINTAGGTIDSYYHPDYVAATYDADRDPATPEVPWPDVDKRYATSVRRLDDCVADLRRTLEDLGVARDTLIVFTTDNGPSIESYLPEDFRADFFNSFGPFDGIKRDCLEGGIRVGALATWPAGIPAGRTSELPSQFADWLPTFCELAGVPAPARSTGTSLVPTLRQREGQRTPVVYVEYAVGGATPRYPEFGPANRGRKRGQMQMLRLGDYTGLRYEIDAGSDSPVSASDPFEIYDIMKDPGQRTNLAAALPDVQRQLQERSLRLRRPNPSAPRPYDDSPVPAVAVAGKLEAGVEWQRYEGDFPWVPATDSVGLKPAASGFSKGLDLKEAGHGEGEKFALRFSGHLQVPEDGAYEWSLRTDGRAVLRLHEAVLIDADFGYTAGTEKSARAILKAGCHPFVLTYLPGVEPTRALALEWSGPSFARRPVEVSRSGGGD